MERDRSGLVQEYRQLDKLLILTGTSDIIAANTRRPSVAAIGEPGVIRREGMKKSRHLPVRELIARTRNTSLAIKPCFMMSPLAVSQYLPADMNFDVVAAQLRQGDLSGAAAQFAELVAEAQAAHDGFHEAISLAGPGTALAYQGVYPTEALATRARVAIAQGEPEQGERDARDALARAAESVPANPRHPGMPDRSHKHPPVPVGPPRNPPPWPSAPGRDLGVVDPAARSYRVVSLYRFLLCDSQAHDPDPDDLRLMFEDPAEVRRQFAELVGLRRGLYVALHAGELVVIPRWRLDGYIWAGEINHVPWLIDRSVDWIQVTADDVVTRADGQVRAVAHGDRAGLHFGSWRVKVGSPNVRRQ